jgi:hypothetical protein
MANVKYWEVEAPKVIEGEKSVAKIYTDNGKIQVFPKVPNTKHGIGRGATLDLETMDVEALKELQKQIDLAIQAQLTTEVAQ